MMNFPGYFVTSALVEEPVDLLQELSVVESLVHILSANTRQILDQLQCEHLRARMFVAQSLLDDLDAFLRSAKPNPTLKAGN